MQRIHEAADAKVQVDVRAWVGGFRLKDPREALTRVRQSSTLHVCLCISANTWGGSSTPPGPQIVQLAMGAAGAVGGGGRVHHLGLKGSR